MPMPFSGSVDVSFVIVSWNAREFLRQCLASITADACRFPFEVVVVDNASRDGSAAMVAENFPEVKLIRSEENLGFAKGNNLGMSVSTGRFLCLINSDVKLLPGCVSGLVDYLEGNPEVGMIAPRILGSDGALQRSRRGFPTLWNMFCRAIALDTLFPRAGLFCGYEMTHVDDRRIANAEVLSGCFWMIRRAALERVGGLDEGFFMYAEDTDWCLRFRKHGLRTVYFPDVEAIHYGGASSSNSPVRFFIERHRADIQCWRKHHSSLSSAAFTAILTSHLVLRCFGFALACALTLGRNRTYAEKMKRNLACLVWMISRTNPGP